MKYTRSYLLSELHRFVFINKRIPKYNELCNGYPLYVHYRKLFKHYWIAIYLAGLSKTTKRPVKSPDLIKRQNKEYYTKHIDDYKKRNKQYRLAHLEEVKIYKKEYRNKHKERLSEERLKYYWDNIEKARLYSKDYYLKNKEEIKNIRKTSEYRNQTNKAKRLWRKNNPEAARLEDSKRKKYDWGWNPINEFFEGAHGHHLHINNHSEGIYIPKELHQSIKHAYDNSESMIRINDAAINWYNQGDKG